MDTITICIKELMSLMGYSEKSAREFSQKIKACVGKDADVPLTVFDLCYFLKIELKDYLAWVEMNKKSINN